MTALAYDAVVVAGGRGTRMGGTDKARLELEGRPLVERACSAVAGARSVVVVGAASVPDGVVLTRESPAFAGPVAAVAAGLAAVSDRAEWTLLLACDLVHPEPVVQALLDALAASDSSDGYVLTDGEGRDQWLSGIYRTDRLRGELARLGDPANRSMRDLLDPVDLARVLVTHEVLADIDTWSAHELWTERLSRPPEG
jgi:molybdopterin-guanine dinucleotide biosynthesis protein A